MQTKHLLSLTVLGASLLPVSGALAQNDAAGTDANTGGAMSAANTMEVGEFRDRLSDLKGMLSKMRENSQLALASQSVVEQGNYQRMNRHLLHRALGVTDEVTLNWRRMDTPEADVQSFGTRDMARFAAESHDTAFVRNTVTQIQSMLLAAKLNGRDTGIVTSDMMSMLDAAIQRAGSANFRVAGASGGSYRSSLSEIRWRDLGEASVSTPSPAAGGETVAANREWREVTIEHENLPARNQVAQADTTVEETYTETTPEPAQEVVAAELPRTGGAPGLLLLFGSGLMGAGGLLLRRRR